MTKLKSKKITKSTIAVIIMAIAMVAMLAFGGTYAYFTATSAQVATSGVTTGQVQLGANSIASITESRVVSGSTIASGVTVSNVSNVETYIFITFDVSLSGEGIDASFVASHRKANLAACSAEGDFCLDYTMDTTVGWTELTGHTGVFYKLADAVDSATTLNVCGAIKFYGISNSNTTSAGVTTTGSLMNKTVSVSISSEAIQSVAESGSAFADAAAAYEVLHPTQP